MADTIEEIKRKSVLSHRILVMTGSMGDITGHVMLKIPDTNEFYYRCRNDDNDVSPAFITQTSLHRVDITSGEATEPLLAGYTMSGERFIGVGVFTARPEVGCVIHAHPPAQVLCSMADVEIKPIVGSQNWGGHDVARQGVAVYPRTMTIVNHVLARAVVAMMSNKNVVLLKAHGNVVAGRNVEEATVRAIQTENIARLCWEIAKVQRNDEYVPWTIPWEDVDNMTSGLPMREASEAQGGGPRRMTNASWEYYVQMLQAGALIPAESTVGRTQY